MDSRPNAEDKGDDTRGENYKCPTGIRLSNPSRAGRVGETVAEDVLAHLSHHACSRCYEKC